MFLCERWVRLEGRGRGLRVTRVYASERTASGARSRGFRVEQCGSTEVSVESVYESVYGYGGWTGESEYDGVEVSCSRCGSQVALYGVYELEDVVRQEFARGA